MATLTREEKELWIGKYYRYIDSYMKINLADKPDLPRLEIKMDEGSYTNKDIIHIGIGALDVDSEEQLTSSVLFLTGHEIQHVRSTTDRAWMYGISRGAQVVCEEYANATEPGKWLFRKDRDYDLYLQSLAKKGFHVSSKALMNFSHFIANSLEDGRIERIRCITRPGFKDYMVDYRGREWNATPINDEFAKHLDDPNTYLTVVLNQVLTLATMSIYQKGFTRICAENSKPQVLINQLMPEIAKGVGSGNCRGCMESSINICRILAIEIMEASKASPLEELLSKLIEAFSNESSYTADSRTEETNSENGSSPFGKSDLVIEVDDETFDKLKDKAQEGGSDGPRIIIKRKNPKPEEKTDEGSSGAGASGGKNSDADPSESTSGNDAGSADSKGSEASGDAAKPEGSKASEGASNASGKPGSSGSVSEPGKPETSLDSSDEIEGCDASENADNAVEKAMRDANESMEEELEDATHLANTEMRNSSAFVEGENKDVLPDMSGIEDSYDYPVSFREEPRPYRPDARMPFELLGMANVLKRKVKRIFQNMQRPVLRGRKAGALDPSNSYKLAVNEFDCFMKKGQVAEFDGCAYLLADNSGSMRRDERRYYCCRALAVIEHAFCDIMPLKIVAFDALGSQSVRHQVIKNWSEKISCNGSYNFLVKDDAGSGNKDGYSIRVATKELLERPEKKKLLFVLSDGLPSDYPGSMSEGMKDVHNAVVAARKKGIMVVAIFFGPPENESSFRDMYEKNCIVTEPANISTELVRMLKRFCFR